MKKCSFSFASDCWWGKRCIYYNISVRIKFKIVPNSAASFSWPHHHKIVTSTSKRRHFLISITFFSLFSYLTHFEVPQNVILP